MIHLIAKGKNPKLFLFDAWVHKASLIGCHVSTFDDVTLY
jgi:hypothetical protein